MGIAWHLLTVLHSICLKLHVLVHRSAALGNFHIIPHLHYGSLTLLVLGHFFPLIIKMKLVVGEQ